MYHRILLAVKTVQIYRDMTSYLVLRVLNVHAPNREKSDDSKHNFYEELEQVFSIVFLSTT